MLQRCMLHVLCFIAVVIAVLLPTPRYRRVFFRQTFKQHVLGHRQEKPLAGYIILFSTFVQNLSCTCKVHSFKVKMRQYAFATFNMGLYCILLRATAYHGLCGSNKLLYKRCAFSMGGAKFRPPQLPHFSSDLSETQN